MMVNLHQTQQQQQQQQQPAEPHGTMPPVSLTDLPVTLHEFLTSGGGGPHHQVPVSGSQMMAMDHTAHHPHPAHQDQVVNNNNYHHGFLTSLAVQPGSLGIGSGGRGGGGDPVLGSAKFGLLGLSNGS